MPYVKGKHGLPFVLLRRKRDENARPRVLRRAFEENLRALCAVGGMVADDFHDGTIRPYVTFPVLSVLKRNFPLSMQGDNTRQDQKNTNPKYLLHFSIPCMLTRYHDYPSRLNETDVIIMNFSFISLMSVKQLSISVSGLRAST